MIKRFFIFLILFNTTMAAPGKRVYVNKIYAQLHQNASKFSRIISTFECGQPFKIVGEKKLEYYKVRYATYEGYIADSLVSDKKPSDCWQDKYRKFLDNMNLGVSDMHHWGKLQDMFLEGSVMP